MHGRVEFDEDFLSEQTTDYQRWFSLQLTKAGLSHQHAKCRKHPLSLGRCVDLRAAYCDKWL
jgi:hypothetical protein